MLDRRRFIAGTAAALLASGARAQEASWVDAETGHRVVQFMPGNTKGLYFHQNCFTMSGDKMVYRAPTAIGPQDFVWDFRTKQSYQLTYAPGGTNSEILGPKTRTLYFRNGRTIHSTQIDTLRSRVICELPGDLTGYTYALSADEKTLASGFIEGGEEIARLPRGQMFVRMFDARLRNVIYTVDIESGRFEEVHEEDTWLGHFQFSPTDPNTLMFCHEGPWERLDRVWLLDLAANETRLVYTRKHPGEIAGHEFWDPSGERVWFDLRNLETGTFALAMTDLATGGTTAYPLKPEEWSYHYNIGRHTRFLCGDGGQSGRWIYRFTPQADETLAVTRLCGIADNDYSTCEPNVHVTPDGRWAVFTSNMTGKNRLYAVSTEPEDSDG